MEAGGDRSARAGLAARDDPVDATQIEIRQSFEQRFEREKLDTSMRGAKEMDAVDICGALHTHSHPDVFRPVDQAIEVRQAFSALGQHLKPVPVGAAHGVEHLLDVIDRDRIMKKVAHRVDED